jgi:hypothetical protein
MKSPNFLAFFHLRIDKHDRSEFRGCYPCDHLLVSAFQTAIFARATLGQTLKPPVTASTHSRRRQMLYSCSYTMCAFFGSTFWLVQHANGALGRPVGALRIPQYPRSPVSSPNHNRRACKDVSLGGSTEIELQSSEATAIGPVRAQNKTMAAGSPNITRLFPDHPLL